MAALCAPGMRRLKSEHYKLMKNPVAGCTVEPSDMDYFSWDLSIVGQKDSWYEGATLKGLIRFPLTYPTDPPAIRFTSKVLHPNVHKNGYVCMSILNKPENAKNRNKGSAESWCSGHTVEGILTSLLLVLATPNCEDPANSDAAHLYKRDREKFAQAAKRLLSKQSLG